MARTLGLVLLLTATSAMAIDLRPMWDFSNPALSEERFHAALASAQGDDVLILETQIARSWGLRRNFDKARAILAKLQPQIAQAGAEAQTRYWLELGRTWASATHEPVLLTPQAKTQARDAYERALVIA